MTLLTIVAYCVSIAVDYDDGVVVREQASSISIIATLLIVIRYIIQQPSQTQIYLSILTMFTAIIGAILACYWIFSWSRTTLPRMIQDYSIVIR